MNVTPYLFFNGRCEEALEFYRETVGAEIGMKLRYKDSPQPHDPKMVPEGNLDLIMHSAFKVGETALMASDGCAASRFDGFGLSLQPGTAAEAERLFAALEKGGQVRMPLTETFFSPRFGMVVDKFGICWMINVQPAAS